MILPFDRRKLAERNQLDEEDELDAVEQMTPEERLTQGIELSSFARDLAIGLGNRDMLEHQDDLEEKALFYVRPLRLIRGA